MNGLLRLSLTLVVGEESAAAKAMADSAFSRTYSAGRAISSEKCANKTSRCEASSPAPVALEQEAGAGRLPRGRLGRSSV